MEVLKQRSFDVNINIYACFIDLETAKFEMWMYRKIIKIK